MKRLLLILLTFSTATFAEKTDEEESTFKLGGYIKNESFFDSRQVFGVGDDLVLLYPEKKLFDAQGNDINAKAQFNTLPIESELWLKIEGPPIKNAQSSAYIDGNFFGSVAQLSHREILNIIHLRNALFQIAWHNTDLLVGQFWHLLYILKCEPKTVGLNTGIPIEPFSRNPQFRLDQTFGPIKLLFMAASQLDFLSDGPIGPSSTYLRNAIIPNLGARFDWHIHDHVIGVGIDFKRISPRLETNLGFKTDEGLNSFAAIAFASFHWKDLIISNKFTYAQNGRNLSLIGGYAVHSIDPNTDKRTYTNLNVASFWTDWQLYASKPLQPGFFFGIIKTLGARKSILHNVTDENGTVIDRRIYGLGTDINYVLRASGRLTWQVKDFKLGAEIEYTRSPYGTINDCGKVINTVPVSNIRFLIALYYYI